MWEEGWGGRVVGVCEGIRGGEICGGYGVCGM